MVMVWLGEQMPQRGIGNGISLLITVSIISGLLRRHPYGVCSSGRC